MIYAPEDADGFLVPRSLGSSTEQKRSPEQPSQPRKLARGGVTGTAGKYYLHPSRPAEKGTVAPSNQPIITPPWSNPRRNL